MAGVRATSTANNNFLKPNGNTSSAKHARNAHVSSEQSTLDLDTTTYVCNGDVNCHELFRNENQLSFGGINANRITQRTAPAHPDQQTRKLRVCSMKYHLLRSMSPTAGPRRTSGFGTRPSCSFFVVSVLALLDMAPRPSALSFSTKTVPSPNSIPDHLHAFSFTTTYQTRLSWQERTTSAFTLASKTISTKCILPTWGWPSSHAVLCVASFSRSNRCTPSPVAFVACFVLGL